MANQWDTVTWNKSGERQKGVSKQSQLNRARRAGNVTTAKKHGAGGNIQNGSFLNGKNLDDDNETLKHKTVTMELRKILQQERTKAGLSQKDLAAAINMKPIIIGNYESGKGIPNPQLLTKIERIIKKKNPEFVIGTLTKAAKGSKKPKKK